MPIFVENMMIDQKCASGRKLDVVYVLFSTKPKFFYQNQMIEVPFLLQICHFEIIMQRSRILFFFVDLKARINFLTTKFVLKCHEVSSNRHKLSKQLRFTRRDVYCLCDNETRSVIHTHTHARASKFIINVDSSNLLSRSRQQTYRTMR